MSNQAYLNNIKQGAIQGWHTHKILPSLTGAQAALESGWGSSKLSKPPYNNNFGIKAGADWTGRTVNMSTQEWVGGRYITINDSFRAYDSLSDSVKDHAAFFTNTPWRTQNYRNVVGERDYKRVAQAVSSAGYATDPSYTSKIIRIIEENNLYNWDQEAFNGNVASSGSTQENTNKEKTVGKDISTAAKTTTEDYTITVIGDSLGVGTEPFLKQLKWSKANYDNYGSRQWTHSTKIYSAIDILTDLASAGSLNNNVIFILGTNRGVDVSEIDTAVGIVGRDRNIILVDTASEVNHRNTVSNRYREASKRHENVFYANWSDKARPNIASWYYADGAGGTRIHMNSTGYKKHADFIVQAIYEANATNWEKEINTPTQKSEENIDIYNIEYDDGKYTSPKGDSSIYNAELNQQYGFKPRKGQIMWVERIYEGDEDNPSDLLEGALRFMEEHSVPSAQYTVNMRYLPEDIAIGDTGIFVDHEFNPPLYIEARVLEINTSVSNPESDSVVLGNVIEVHPKDKSDILSIQKELQKTREDLQTEFWKEKPVNLEMLTSNGLHLSTDNYIPKNELNKYKYDHVKVENGTGIVHLNAPRKSENDFTFYGHIADNYIDAVDELVDEIINIDGEEIIFDEPIDPNTNPQGPDVLDPNDLGEIRELKVKEFDVEFLDILGRKIGEDTIQVYEDSTFSYKVSGYTQSINKINILSTSSFTLDVVSFKEDDDYKSPFADKTRLYVKAIQEDGDVTYKFKNFIWTRVSDNQRSDEEWNDINKWNETSGINLTASDIEGNESTFICRMYDDDFNFVNAIGATVKIALEGKSAYEQAVENGYEGTEEEWIDSLKGTDGTNGVPGKPGEDGRTPYMHTAWATDPLGTNFSTEPFERATYLGTCTTETPEDPEDYSLYDWVYVKGEPGLTDEEREELMDSIEDTHIIKDLIGLDGGQTFNKNRLDGPVNRVIAKGSSTSINHNGDGYNVGDKITISADISCLIIEPTTGEVQFDFNIVDYQPPIKPVGEVQFVFNVPGYVPTEPTESNFDNARAVNLSDYGGTGDGVTDNFDAFKRVIDASVNEPLVLKIDNGNYFVEGGTNTRLEPWPNKSKGLRIEGTGDNVNIYHKNNRTINRHEHYFMQLVMTPDSLGFEAENFTLDGIRNPQEELFYTQSETNPITNIPMARGISVDGAHHVNVNNVTFKNMYGGYAIQLQEYRDVSITNTTYDKVGGNDQQESFGMAIYLGGHAGNAVVKIDNAQAQGMVTDKDLKLSWIGVVLENGSIQSKNSSDWLRDKNTVVRITNSSFLDYHSTFHTESIAGNVYWNVDNVKARGSNYNIVAGVYGEFKEVSNRVTMDVLPYGRLWGIVKGLYYSEPQEKEDNWNGHNKLEMHNSVINFIKVAGFDDPPQAIAYGNNVMGRLYNTQLNNVPNRLVTNGSALLYNSEVNLAQGNNATRASLMAGYFSDPSKQKVEFTNTGVNPYGSHKNVTFGSKPAEAKNTGFEAPWIDLPITAPI